MKPNLNRLPKRPHAAESVFDGLASSYAIFNENPMVISFRTQVHQVISRFVPAESRILDLGCGPGSDFDFWASRQDRVVAIDASAKMIQLANSHNPKHADITVKHATLSLFKSERRFDAILMNFGVWNALGNSEEVHRQLKSLLAPEGIIIAVVMPPLHLAALFEDVLRLRLRHAKSRILERYSTTSSGWKFRYLSAPDFVQEWSILDQQSLGPLLPSPDQLGRIPLARSWLRLMEKVDRWFGAQSQLIGGDHIIFVLQAK